MCIHLDLGGLKSCRGLTQDQHFEGGTELKGASKTPLKEQTLNAAFAFARTGRTECSGSDYSVVFE